MSFRDSLNEDLENVFFNQNEFAEECSWNKEKITAIIDDDDLIEKYSSEFNTLPQGSHLVYAAENQFSRQPNINEAVVFNGDIYTVNEIKAELGMLAIFLSNGRG